MRTRFLAVSMLLFVVCSCGNDMTDSSPFMTLSGAWDATLTVTGGTELTSGTQFTVTLALVQTGSAVSGTFARQGGATGSIAGNIVSSTLNLTATQDPPCAGTFHGAGTTSASYAVLDGTYNGDDCNGTLESTFTASKR
jgi:hypothetical protein